jgi:hypothetical protein
MKKQTLAEIHNYKECPVCGRSIKKEIMDEIITKLKTLRGIDSDTMKEIERVINENDN